MLKGKITHHAILIIFQFSYLTKINLIFKKLRATHNDHQKRQENGHWSSLNRPALTIPKH